MPRLVMILVSAPGEYDHTSLPVTAFSATIELFFPITYISSSITIGLKKYFRPSPVG
jgi:hypothetical protein